jgi:hypothetical protein
VRLIACRRDRSCADDPTISLSLSSELAFSSALSFDDVHFGRHPRSAHLQAEAVAHPVSYFLKQLSIVGSAPEGHDGRVDCDTVAFATSARDDRRPASRPRVWSVRCHRVELPPQFPRLRCSEPLPRAGNCPDLTTECGETRPIFLSPPQTSTRAVHNGRAVGPDWPSGQMKVTARPPARSGIPAPAQARDIGVLHRVEVDAVRRDQPLRHSRSPLSKPAGIVFGKCVFDRFYQRDHVGENIVDAPLEKRSHDFRGPRRTPAAGRHTDSAVIFASWRWSG